MGTKITGLLLIAISIYLIVDGLSYKGKEGYGKYLVNIQMTGAGVLLFLLAVAIFSSNKTLCELFGIFC